MVKRRVDSIQEMNKRKTNEQLTAENAALREQVEGLETQLTDTQLALCDVYELLTGGEA
ncbi:MAG: hypothetical protein OSJ58_13800 [Dysosmobacter sp.]|nr:hypothetical protein [uncultured Oscillibacter sp.]MCX4372869.1 hypothetical protein [Dysosmobacter sp.]